MPEPIISDADLVAWNVTRHTFIITPTAAKRLIGQQGLGGHGQFVLMTSGQPIYLGMFGSSTSSSSYALPVILTDSVLSQCFVGWTNVPLDVLRMIGLKSARNGSLGVEELDLRVSRSSAS